MKFNVSILLILLVAAIFPNSSYSQEGVSEMLKKLSDSDPRIRKDTVQLFRLTYQKEYAYEIAKMLYDKDAFVRNEAILTLEYFKAKDYVSEIAKLLNDENSSVRSSAACALGEFGAREYIDEIAKLLGDKTASHGAIQALGKMGAKQYADKIAEFLYDNDAILALKRMEAWDKLKSPIVLEIVDGNNQVGLPYQSLKKELIIRAYDTEKKQPVSGLLLDFGNPSGGTFISSKLYNTITNDDGIAGIGEQLGNVGTYKVVVGSNDIYGANVPSCLTFAGSSKAEENEEVKEWRKVEREEELKRQLIHPVEFVLYAKNSFLKIVEKDIVATKAGGCKITVKIQSPAEGNVTLYPDILNKNGESVRDKEKIGEFTPEELYVGVNKPAASGFECETSFFFMPNPDAKAQDFKIEIGNGFKDGNGKWISDIVDVKLVEDDSKNIIVSGQEQIAAKGKKLAKPLVGKEIENSKEGIFIFSGEGAFEIASGSEVAKEENKITIKAGNDRLAGIYFAPYKTKEQTVDVKYEYVNSKTKEKQIIQQQFHIDTPIPRLVWIPPDSNEFRKAVGIHLAEIFDKSGKLVDSADKESEFYVEGYTTIQNPQPPTISAKLFALDGSGERANQESNSSIPVEKKIDLHLVKVLDRYAIYRSGPIVATEEDYINTDEEIEARKKGDYSFTFEKRPFIERTKTQELIHIPRYGSIQSQLDE